MTDTLPMDWATGDGTAEEPIRLYELNGLLFTMDTDEPVICSWFAMCENQAADVRQHPALGGVPICQRCNDKMSA